jgi:hypothetical protein
MITHRYSTNEHDEKKAAKAAIKRDVDLLALGCHKTVKSHQNPPDGGWLRSEFNSTLSSVGVVSGPSMNFNAGAWYRWHRLMLLRFNDL